MLEEIKKFISKWIKNPVVISIVAYLIYKTLSNYIRQESLNKTEGIKIVQSKDDKEVIYDIDTKMYALVNKNEILEISKDKIVI